MFLLTLGLVLLVVAEVALKEKDGNVSKRVLNASGFFIAMGLFGTFSGITNLLANLLLFYGIPYLPGTGSVGNCSCLIAVTNAVY